MKNIKKQVASKTVLHRKVEVTVSADSSPEKDTQAGGVFINSEVVDLTEKKLNEFGSEKSEKLFTSIVNLSPAGIYMTDKKGKYTFVNEAWCRMSGLTPEEAYGDGWIKGIHPDDREYIFKTWNKFVGSGSGWNWEYRFLDKKGNITWVFGRAEPLMNEKGETTGYLGNNSDITEKILSDEKLIESEEKFRTYFEKSPIGIELYDDRGLQIDANDSSLKIFGIEKEDKTIGFNLFKGTSLPKKLKEELLRGQTVEYYASFNFERVRELNQYKTSKSGISNLYYIITPLKSPSNEHLQGYLLMVQDVTELKKAEESLMELSKHIEDARDKERREIALNLHDDLGQKLTALKMDISWLKSRMGVQSSVVKKKISDLSDLLDDSVLTIQKMSSDLRPSVLYDLGLVPAIQWKLDEFSNSSGINCNFRLSTNEISVSEKLSVAIFRILQESLTNISRHANAKNVFVSFRKIKNILVLLVEDDGAGIDSEKLTDPKSLGLLGMKERIKPFNGSVKVSGKEGKGTMVEVRVPVEG